MLTTKISLVQGLIYTQTYNQWYVAIEIVLATKQTLLSIVLVNHGMLRPTFRLTPVETVASQSESWKKCNLQMPRGAYTEVRSIWKKT